jgi:hypothetical protein
VEALLPRAALPATSRAVATFDTARRRIGRVTRRERIAFLLEHFHDVLAGVRKKGLGGDTYR